MNISKGDLVQWKRDLHKTGRVTKVGFFISGDTSGHCCWVSIKRNSNWLVHPESLRVIRRTGGGA